MLVGERRGISFVPSLFLPRRMTHPLRRLFYHRTETTHTLGSLLRRTGSADC